jgi:hypothetical protein
LKYSFETGSLSNKDLYKNLHGRLNILGKKINNFLKYTQQSHFRPGDKVEEPEETYSLSNEDPAFSENPESRIQDQVPSSQDPETRI